MEASMMRPPTVRSVGFGHYLADYPMSIGFVPVAGDIFYLGAHIVRSVARRGPDMATGGHHHITDGALWVTLFRCRLPEGYVLSAMTSGEIYRAELRGAGRLLPHEPIGSLKPTRKYWHVVLLSEEDRAYLDDRGIIYDDPERPAVAWPESIIAAWQRIPPDVPRDKEVRL